MLASQYKHEPLCNFSGSCPDAGSAASITVTLNPRLHQNKPSEKYLCCLTGVEAAKGNKPRGVTLIVITDDSLYWNTVSGCGNGSRTVRA